jgi:perosamine synthetase
MDFKIPLFKIYSDKADIEAVNETINRGSYWAIGPEIAELEERLAKYLNVKYCLTFNSGTSALHAILMAYGIGPGDEVIVPSFTFIATANSALFVGAKPVFADIEEKTFGLDPADIERKITPRTKAIMPIHYGGNACLITEIKEVAARHKLPLIEDAAESLGAEVNGIKVGSIGDSAILSFCQNKLLATGEGGAVVTKSQEIYEKLKLIRSHGRQESANYFATTEYMDYVTLGFNFRLSSISAALGLAQLDKLEKLVEMRRKAGQSYDRKLSSIKTVIPPFSPKGVRHVYQMYTIRLPEQSRDRVMKHLEGAGIMSKVFFFPVHRTHFYKNVLKYNSVLPVTDKIAGEALTLPMYPSISEAETTMVTDRIAEYFSKQK